MPGSHMVARPAVRVNKRVDSLPSHKRPRILTTLALLRSSNRWSFLAEQLSIGSPSSGPQLEPFNAHSTLIQLAAPSFRVPFGS
jgi:hypothetical protein